MPTIEHVDIDAGEVHRPYNWAYADAAARTGATGFVAGDVGKLARQTDDNSLWMLTDDSPVTWLAIATIAANSVTNAQLAQMAAHTFKGNNTAGAANALDLTATQLTAELNVFAATLKGLVPAAGAVPDATKYLSEDGTFTTPAGGGGSGTVNSGSAKQLAYYPASAAAVSGAAGYEYDAATSPNVKITAQNAAHIGLRIWSAATPSVNVFEVSANNGTNVHFAITSTGAPTAQGTAGALSERYGAGSNAGTSSTDCLAVGANAAITNGSDNATVIGSASTGTNNDTLVGQAITSGGSSNTYVGAQTGGSGIGGVALGRASQTAAAHLVAGSATFPIADIYFGKGITSTTAAAVTIHGTGGSGSNNAGAVLNIAGGRGTGTGLGGAVVIQVAPAGASSSTLNPLVTSATFPITGGMIMPEVASPATPAANSGHWYVKDVGGLSRPFFIGDDGTDIELGLGGTSTWSGLTNPSGNLSLAMAANLTLLTWAGNYSTGSAFKLVASDTTATGALLHVSTAVSTLMPPLLVDARGAQRLKVNQLGDVVIGQSGIGGGDTDGFPYIPVVASNAFPSGTPTGQTGFAPLVAYSNGINGEFGVASYLNGVWRDLIGWRNRYGTATGTGTVSIDFNSCTGANVTRTFTFGAGNVTFTFDNPPPAGSLVTLIVVQDGVGSRTATWPGTVQWAGGVAPTLSTGAAARDIFQFVWDSSNYWPVSQTLNAS